MFKFIRPFVYSVKNLFQFHEKNTSHSKINTTNEVSLKNKNALQYERIKNLKFLSKQANNYLSEYKELRKNKSKNWENEKAEIAIIGLNDIIKQINNALNPTKLDSYFKPEFKDENAALRNLLNKFETEESILMNNYLREVFIQPNLNFLLVDILYFAPKNNILQDINWCFDRFSLQSIVDYGLGNIDESFFTNSLNGILEEIETRLLPYYTYQSNLNNQTELLKDAILLSKKDSFLASNIILYSLIESITRELCKFVYKFQNPKLSDSEVDKYITYQFASLDGLIEKGKFQNDIPISIALVVTAYKDVNDKHINDYRIKYLKHCDAYQKIEKGLNQMKSTIKGNETENVKLDLLKKLSEKMSNLSKVLLEDSDKTIRISITTKLNFLRRKYKDDRNDILHGNYNELNSKFKNCINYLALLKLQNIEKEYKDIVQQNNPTST